MFATLKRAVLFASIVGGLIPAGAGAEIRLLAADSRLSHWQSEAMPLCLHTTTALAGQMVLSVVAEASPSRERTIARIPIKLPPRGTVVWDLAPFALSPGRYRLVARVGTEVAQLPDVRISSPVPVSHFLFGCTASPEENARLGATWAGMNLYEYAKLDSSGGLSSDPLAQSGFERGVDRLVGAGLRGFIWNGLWSGYVLHQPFEGSASFSDPDLRTVAMQAAELGAQRARRYGGTVASMGGMDEPGLPPGVVPSGPQRGQLLSTFPTVFERAAYKRDTGVTLPPDPRTLPPSEWLRWMRWRCTVMSRFMAQARTHVKRVSTAIPWGQDCYAAFAINDGTNPFAQRTNDVPTTHTFMFWRGAAEQAWNLALERCGRRDRRFHFASNTTYLGYNDPDGTDLTDVATNYAIMGGVGMLWHLNFASPDQLAPSFRRLGRYGDFILATMPERAPIAVLYSFTEAAMRLRATRGGDNDAIYRAPRAYAQECCALYHAIRRSGYTADIVHEDELPEGQLAGRRALFLVGLRHPLSPRAANAIVAWARRGGVLFEDANTTWLPKGVRARRIPASTEPFVRYIERLDAGGQRMWREGRYTEATRLTRQLASDAWLDHLRPVLRGALAAAVGPPELGISSASVIPGKWVAGAGRYYLLLNDSQRDPRTPTGSATVDGRQVPIYPASVWAEANGVRIALNTLRPGEAVYAIEGRNWTSTRRLDLRRGAPIAMSFQPTEMKVLCVLPSPVAAVRATVRCVAAGGARRLQMVATVVGRSRTPIKAPVPLAVTITGPNGARRTYNRSSGPDGVYHETLALAADEPAGVWAVEVTDRLSGHAGRASVKVAPFRGALAVPEPSTLVADAGAILGRLRSRQPLVVVLGDAATPAERAIATELVGKLTAVGLHAKLAQEGSIVRRRLYPRVFPAVQKNGDAWEDLTPAERRTKQRPWDRLTDWPGNNGYPPTPPDAYQATGHLVLVGTDSSSTLVRALQRASILHRVANALCPGPGRGLLEYVWSPFELGNDVVLVTGSDEAGVRRAAQKLASLAGGLRASVRRGGSERRR